MKLIKTDNNCIINENGVKIPCYVIREITHLRKQSINNLQNMGLTNIYDNNLQLLYDTMFQMYYLEHGKKHPIQLICNDDELNSYHMKNEYLRIKELIKKYKGLINYDYPELNICQGFRAVKHQDEKDDYIQIWDVHPSFENGYITTEIDKNDIIKMYESII